MNTDNPFMNVRVGFGYDVHQLASGRKLILGGVDIPHEKGPVAHSDGDVLVHALCDALLGAANLRDIGYHFPDTSGEFKDIQSMILLERTMALIHSHGYRLGNADTTVCLQRPKIMDFVPRMTENLAKVMETSPSCVSVKATTHEKMGFVGKEKGIAAYAVVLIYKEA
jgi:2-C-methyl-D-erythritol 2,4-cyclodiphosphate synthase